MASSSSTADLSLSYWCYHCDKRVAVESHSDRPDVVCRDCKNGFVALISAPPPSSTTATDDGSGQSNSSFNHHFLQILRLFSGVANIGHRQHVPTRPIEDSNDAADGGVSWYGVPEPDAGEPPENDDFLRIEIDDGWEEANFEGDEEEEEGEGEAPQERAELPDVVRVRTQDRNLQFSGGGSRHINWHEILRGIEDNSIELRVEFGERYVGNQDDYVDAAGFELVLQNLAENDSGSKKGAPPASRSAVLGLPAVIFSKQGENNLCPICKEGASAGEKGITLPCGHIYHEECIFTWLNSRNSCPVCRFELPTDDPEYEEQRKNAARAGNRSFRSEF